jgi:AraC-like DNA-binding protein
MHRRVGGEKPGRCGCGGLGLPPAPGATAPRRSTLACRGRTAAMPAEVAAGLFDRARLRECIQAQRCPWCDRGGLRSLANHTVLAHGVYADELRELAGLGPDTPLCSRGLSERHRELARDQDPSRWLHRPEVRAAAAATREANYDAEQRRRRVAQLNAVRKQAIDAWRRSLQAEKDDPDLAAARKISRSKAQRKFRAGQECAICGVWYCTVVPPGRDYRQRKFCSDACRGEAIRRLRRRTWVRRSLESLHEPAVAPSAPRRLSRPPEQ